jgi:hypothetical protein
MRRRPTLFVERPIARLNASRYGDGYALDAMATRSSNSA